MADRKKPSGRRNPRRSKPDSSPSEAKKLTSWEDREEVGYRVERRSTAVRLERRLGQRWLGFWRYNYQRVDLSDVEDKTPRVAYVHENLCVGCTKCFKRCPTDAILGASKMIHAVFPDACTGCQKCFDVCPTECIEMRPIRPTLQTWYWPMPVEAA